MSVKPTYVCDVCGATRKEANHWFLVLPEVEGLIKIAGWDSNICDGYRDQSGVKHLCGQACVHSVMDAWMELSRKTVPVDALAEYEEGIIR
jgi:hypothetical protein